MDSLSGLAGDIEVFMVQVQPGTHVSWFFGSKKICKQNFRWFLLNIQDQTEIQYLEVRRAMEWKLPRVGRQEHQQGRRRWVLSRGQGRQTSRQAHNRHWQKPDNFITKIQGWPVSFVQKECQLTVISDERSSLPRRRPPRSPHQRWLLPHLRTLMPSPRYPRASTARTAASKSSRRLWRTQTPSAPGTATTKKSSPLISGEPQDFHPHWKHSWCTNNVMFFLAFWSTKMLLKAPAES